MFGCNKLTGHGVLIWSIYEKLNAILCFNFGVQTETGVFTGGLKTVIWNRKTYIYPLSYFIYIYKFDIYLGKNCKEKTKVDRNDIISVSIWSSTQTRFMNWFS